MITTSSPYAAAWQLIRLGALRRMRHRGSVQRRVVDIPGQAAPSSVRTSAVLTSPPAPRGWVIVPHAGPSTGQGGSNPTNALAALLHGVGLGTLELTAASDAAGLDARVERLLEAARWLGREGSAARARLGMAAPSIGLAGLGVDAAAALAVAGTGLVELAAVVAAGGRYDELDAARLGGLRAPARLIAARDDATGLWAARQVAGWLPASAWSAASALVPTAHGVATAAGTAAGFTPAGWRQARWLAGAWLAEHMLVEDASDEARRRALWRLRLARGGLSALPLGAALATAWLVAPGQPQGAPVVQAAARRWGGVGEAQGVDGGLSPNRLSAVLPGTIELSGLSGPNGFRANGISAYDLSGSVVSGAGDVNRDGFADILIGANNADPHGSSSGQSYVVYGGSGAPGTVELSALSGTNGFVVNGISTNDFSGGTVSGAGDVNKDGFADILIGAHRADPHGSDSGQSYVVYGGSGMPGTVELSALNGTNGFVVNGISTGDHSGYAVSGAGDVNGDGFADILIGAPNADPHGNLSGQSYVVYGGSAVPGTVELSALNGTNGFVVNGISANNYSGRAESGAGDVNKDGFADILIGARNAGLPGQSYVVYGGSGLPGTVELSALNGTNGFVVNGISTGDYSGKAVSGAGDVNQDGFADILIGAPRADPHGNISGQSYVVYGGSGLPGTVDLSALNGTNGFVVNGISTGDQSGVAVSGAGDVNRDGFADILIGANLSAPHGIRSGQSYVVYGGSAVPGTVDVSALSGTNGFVVNGISSYDYSGEAVSGAGDVNRDGFADILVGALRADPHGSQSGQSYVVYGDGLDRDGDGVFDTVEDGAPNMGDGNSDGTADRLQGNVASLPNAADGAYMTVVAPAGMKLAKVKARPNPSPGNAPAGVPFPAAFVEFTLATMPAPPSSVTVQVLYQNAIATNQYWRYGPEPGNPADHWYRFDPVAGGTGATRISATRWDLTFVDGARGDDDLTVNGTLVDQGGPGGPAPTATPGPTATPVPTAGPPLPVQLAGFEAARTGRAVTLSWKTLSEIKNAGFRLWRSGADGRLEPVGPALIPARGGELGGGSYRFVDETAPRGALRYWLEDVSTTGVATRHGPAMVPAYRGPRPIERPPVAPPGE